MSGPRITDAAVEAGARALHAADGTSSFDEWDGMADHERGWFREEARTVLTAAYPHIRRAVIEELVEKYHTFAENAKVGAVSAGARLGLETTAALLEAEAVHIRAEMEGDDRA